MISETISKYKGTSIIDSTGKYSFEDLLKQTKKYNEFLSDLLVKDDRVIIYSDYTFHSISLFLSLSSFPINIIPIVKTTHLEYTEKVDVVSPHHIISFDKKNQIQVKKCKVVDSDESRFNQVTSEGNTGVVLFSSGTTGRPKVMIQNLTQIINSIQVPRRQKSLRFIILLMFDHIGGLNTLLNCLISGMPFVIPENRNPSTIISSIYKHKVNVLPSTPTFMNLLLMDESFSSKTLESLKLITYGTERMSETLLNKLNNSLPKVKLLQTFGTSETGILKTKSKSSSSLYFKIVDPDKEFKILDGELYIRSKTQVQGYLNHENKNFKIDGWYATGDLIEKDDEGYIKIIGRKNNIINVGGLKVLPKEIEDVINSVEGVIDSTVFAEQNNLIGNIICVKIHTNDNDTKALKLKIKESCKLKLDKFKCPMKYYFESLKVSTRGKKLT